MRTVSLVALLLCTLGCVHAAVEEGDLLSGLAALVGGLNGATGGTECALPCDTPLMPREGYKPHSNGCGTSAIKLDLSAYPELEACCDTHDLCYAKCHMRRDQCDRQFAKCLTRKCRKRYNANEVGLLACTSQV